MVDVGWEPDAKNTYNIASYYATDEEAFMYRAMQNNLPDRVFVAVPMRILDTEHQSRRAYGVASYVNHKIQCDLTLLASAPQAALITTLRDSGTAVSLATATTYKMMDSVNARLYARAVGDGSQTLKDIGEAIYLGFCWDSDDPLHRVDAR